jgi:hypothetical protein
MRSPPAYPAQGDVRTQPQHRHLGLGFMASAMAWAARPTTHYRLKTGSARERQMVCGASAAWQAAAYPKIAVAYTQIVTRSYKPWLEQRRLSGTFRITRFGWCPRAGRGRVSVVGVANRSNSFPARASDREADQRGRGCPRAVREERIPEGGEELGRRSLRICSITAGSANAFASGKRSRTEPSPKE